MTFNITLSIPQEIKPSFEHIGRHLYLIACPSQHGLSPCFFGNLSQVIGFLPEDKDLHEQRLASRSSSNLDLDEDIRSKQVDQDSLRFQCSNAFSLDLAHGDGKAADSGGEPKVSFDPKYLQQPTPSSAHERELHNMTHIPSQPWCVVCQEAKVQASQSRQRSAFTTHSTIQLAYAYVNQPQDQEPSLILLWVESLTGLAGSLITKEKGTTAQQLDAVVTFIHSHGFAHSTLQCDEEPALVKLVKEIGKQTSLPSIKSPSRRQKLDGWKRSLLTQLRTLMLDYSQRHKLHPSSLMISSSLGQHMLRHAVWLLNRLHLHLHSSTTRLAFKDDGAQCIASPVLPFW